MSFISAILSPSFLVDNIELISFVASVMVLIFFDDFFTGKVMFPVADYIRFKIFKHVGQIYEKRKIKSVWAKYARKYSSEAVATVLIIVYCYIGYAFLASYIIQPLLERWKGIIIIVVLVMFLIANYLVNNARMRKRIFGFGISKPETK